MKVILKLPKQWLYLSAIALLFTLIPFSQLTSLKFFPAIAAGCILSLMNAFLGHIIIETGFRLNDKQFFVVSLSGFVVRFFAMIIAVALILIITKINVLAFVLSLMSFYIFFMAIEIMHINRKITSSKLDRVFVRK